MENDNVKIASTKITSVEKEKIKDPRRVAQGKKLAAISREAKERKAKEREAVMQAKLEEKQETSKFSFFNSYAIILVIGIVFGGYYFLYLRPANTEKNENQEEIMKKSKLERL